MVLVLIFFTSLIVALSGAMMPGPLLTVTVAESARRGFIAGPLLIVGHAILELLLVVALVLGFRDVLSSGRFIGVIGLLGGAFLVWMGQDIARRALKGQLSLELEQNSSRATMNPVIAGIVTSISNPYWTLWWATIGAGYVFSSVGKGIPGLAAFFLGHIGGDLLWYSLVALAVVSGRKMLSERAYRGILIACGIFLLVLALYFLYVGFSALARL